MPSVVQEAKDAEGVVTVENLTWSGPYSLLVSAIVHPVEALEDEMVSSCVHAVRAHSVHFLSIQAHFPCPFFSCSFGGNVCFILKSDPVVK